MSESYFGDAVIYGGMAKSSKVIRIFTKSTFTHCALRIDEDTAESIDWPPKVLIHDLNDPKEEYLRYEIYRPRGITALQREALEILNENIAREYDVGLILKLASRHILKKGYSVEDLAKENLFVCSSRMAMLYEMVGIEVLPKVHFSQIEPQHFGESPNFVKIADWVREKNGSEPSESRLEKIKSILPSYRVPLQLEQKK